MNRIDSTTTAPGPDLARAQSLALTVGAAALVLSVIGWFVNPDQFFRSYLTGYLFWLGVALGSLPLLLLQYLTGGAWGLAIRRFLEASVRTLPFMALLFVPIVLGMHSLYEWTHADAVAADEVLRHKAAYLNRPFWCVRAVAYFAVWIGLTWRVTEWSREQDRTGEIELARKMQILSGPGIVFYFLAITFAGVDWVMSLDPHWVSSIFAPLIAVGQVLNAFSFSILLLALLAGYPPFAGVVQPSVFHDLGKLLLAFIMVWAYFSFSQFLIIWAGNLPEEIRWYLKHYEGGWFALGIFIVVFHFFVPFFLLLSRDLKRNMRRLAGVAAFIMVMRFIDIFWTVTPLFHPEHLAVHWIDLTALAGIGGIWLWLFLRELSSQPLLPVRDPYLEEAFAHAEH